MWECICVRICARKLERESESEGKESEARTRARARKRESSTIHKWVTPLLGTLGPASTTPTLLLALWHAWRTQGGTERERVRERESERERERARERERV